MCWAKPSACFGHATTECDPFFFQRVLLRAGVCWVAPAVVRPGSAFGSKHSVGVRAFGAYADVLPEGLGASPDDGRQVAVGGPPTGRQRLEYLVQPTPVESVLRGSAVRQCVGDLVQDGAVVGSDTSSVPTPEYGEALRSPFPRPDG